MKHFLQTIYESEKWVAGFQRQMPKCQQASLKVKAERKTCPRLNEGSFGFGPMSDGFHFKLLALLPNLSPALLGKDHWASNHRPGYAF